MDKYYFGFSLFNFIVWLYPKSAKQQRGLLLLDEFTSGTNVQEGTKIFSALVKALKKTSSFSILTTHLDDVSAEADNSYQIVGLSEKAKELMAKATTTSAEININDYMNYELVKTDNSKEIPKNAIDICILLGLDKDIISLI